MTDIARPLNDRHLDSATLMPCKREPACFAFLCANAVSAPVLEINFIITGPQRIVRQARAALTRRARDLAQAREAATAELHSELNASLTGLLLESQLALRVAGPKQEEKLKHVVELARKLRNQLRM